MNELGASHEISSAFGYICVALLCVVMAPSFTAEWTGNSLVCFVLWKQVQPLQRSDREWGGGWFNGVLPTQACCWEALSVRLTRPAPAPRHIAQVIALIIVQPRQLFSESDTGARRFREERREDSSITVWARETIQSLATSSLELMGHVTATCKVINQNNKYCILTKVPTAPFVADSAPASNKRTQRFQASLRSRYKRACVFCLYYCLNLLWKSLLQPPY